MLTDDDSGYVLLTFRCIRKMIGANNAKKIRNPLFMRFKKTINAEKKQKLIVKKLTTAGT